MLYLSLLLLLVPQVATAPADEPTTQPAAPVYDQGPLRSEFVAMREVRLRADDPELAARMQSDLRIQVRLMGAQLLEISRFGDLVLTECVDDTGKSLIDEEVNEATDADTTRAMTFQPQRLRDNGLPLTTRLLPAARTATQLKTARGSVRLILAGETVSLTIPNPLQYHGGMVEDPRLAEMGLEVHIVPASEVENGPPADRCIILQYKTKGEHVKQAAFVDGWMRPISARDTPIETKAGEPCQLYYFDRGAFNDELQLVLDIHPTVEDIRVPVNLDGLELP